MFNVKKGVTLNDFSEETKEFLVHVGFTDADDISELFTDYLKKKGLDLNSKYEGTFQMTFKQNDYKKMNYNRYMQDDIKMRFVGLGIFGTKAKTSKIGNARYSISYGVSYGGACS